MSKALILLVCIAIIGTFSVHSSDTIPQFKLAKTVSSNKAGKLRPSPPSSNGTQSDVAVNAKFVGQAQVFGSFDYECGNSGGWFFACDGTCYKFTGINSFEFVGPNGYRVVLFDGHYCYAGLNSYSKTIVERNTCYYNPFFYTVSALCY
ncbi:hypothetical protein M3Y97_00730200 [Aphelenchoides bicaudatus]|nr:hypothetical protein M3Y97_00730200 [Aphelenchoides bicaudatus]